MKAYADSSFIVALYLQQQSSDRALSFMELYRLPLPFTAWHRLEVRNAIRLAVFHGYLDVAQCKAQLKQLHTDVKDELLLKHVVIDWTEVLRDAEKLGAAHNASLGCRSADLFHVAVARHSRYDTFLTFDQKQGAMAKAAGLALVSP